MKPTFKDGKASLELNTTEKRKLREAAELRAFIFNAVGTEEGQHIVADAQGQPAEPPAPKS